AGMKYFVITTKHHEGFCLWDTKQTDYKATNTPAGRDLVAPMVDAFREEGLKVGFYYSLIDWHHPEFTIDRLHPLRDEDPKRKLNKKRDQKKYAAYMREQVKELLTQYGKIDIMWFDFSYPGDDGKGHRDWESEKLLKVVRELAPDVIIDNRLDLDGAHDFVTPEQWQPGSGFKDEKGNPVVWEACQTFSGSWGYHRDEQTWKSVPQLIGMLVDNVSKGGNLLLNVGPTGRGEFDYRALERLEGMGRWMKYNSRSIYNCGPSEYQAPTDCRYTQNGKRLYLHLLAWPFGMVQCPGLEGKVEYAQFLHDASEVIIDRKPEDAHDKYGQAEVRWPKGVLNLKLPTIKPPVDVPVIELFLK
ncbi:MAG: alpha-L-fucosidase, partial [Planctomycetota bacterium]